MATITLDESLWKQLTERAKRKRCRPERLAVEAVRDHLERLADEELLEESSRTAATAPFKVADTESIIRTYRARRLKGGPRGGS